VPNDVIFCALIARSVDTVMSVIGRAKDVTVFYYSPTGVINDSERNLQFGCCRDPCVFHGMCQLFHMRDSYCVSTVMQVTHISCHVS